MDVWGSGSLAPSSLQPWYSMGVSGQFHASVVCRRGNNVVTSWIEGRMSYIVALDVAEMSKTVSCREWNSGLPACDLVTLLTELSGLHLAVTDVK